jgi:hypothetical protein
MVLVWLVVPASAYITARNMVIEHSDLILAGEDGQDGEVEAEYRCEGFHGVKVGENG